jgi:hypothetical protein
MRHRNTCFVRPEKRPVVTDFVTVFDRHLDRVFDRDFVTILDGDFDRVFDMGFVRSLDTVPQTGGLAGGGAGFLRELWPFRPRTGIDMVRTDTFRPE